MNTLKNFNFLSQIQLTAVIQRGYKVHFLKGPAAERVFTPFEQKQLFDIVNKSQKEDSYLIFNPQRTLQQIQNWKKQLDWITPFYAIKANPTPAHLEIAKQQNLGFDCASQSEISKIIAMNVDPSRIIFSNSIKKINDLKYAAQQNVNLTTADTIDELYKIKAYHPNCEILWRIAIPELHQQTLSTTFSHKFGDDLLTSEDMIKRFKQIKDLGFNLAGIHFHCGSGPSGSQNFAFALDIAQECMKIGRNVGHSMRLLDLGGGFPSGELPQNLIQILERLKGDGDIERVMAEPGRHLAQNSFSLVTHVIGKRNKGGHIMYHLNDGVYHMLNCVLMDNINLAQNNEEWYAEWSDKQQESNQQNNFEAGTLVGMTCDGQDMIAKNVKLPQMEIGDAILINGMGAYTTGPVSNFNGMVVQEKVALWQPQLAYEEQKILKKAELSFCF